MHAGRLERDGEEYKRFWMPFAWQMSLFANAHRNPKKNSKPLTPAHFNPLGDKPPPPRVIKRKMNIDRFCKLMGLD